MTNGTTPRGRDRFRIGRQIGAFVKRLADQAKTRVGGEIRLRLANDESLHQSTCRVGSWSKEFGSLWIPDWLGYFAQIRLLRKPEGSRITCYFC